MDAVDFIFQSGALRRVERSGWKTIGIKPESVAEHSYRSAIIAYILAKMENADEGKAVLAALFHDLHEVRVSDIHLVAKKYVKVEKEKAEEQSLSALPEILEIMKDGEAARIARDADKLELIFQAKEYQDLGNKYVQEWIDNARSMLKTDSAKKLAEGALKRDAFHWLFEARK